MQMVFAGVILETEGNLQKIQKGHLFTIKKCKRVSLIWAPPMFVAALQLLEENNILKKWVIKDSIPKSDLVLA